MSHCLSLGPGHQVFDSAKGIWVDCPGCGHEAEIADMKQRLSVAKLALGFPIVAQHVKRYEDLARDVRDKEAEIARLTAERDGYKLAYIEACRKLDLAERRLRELEEAQ